MFTKLIQWLEIASLIGSWVYDMDEKGVTTVQKTENFVAPKGQKRLGTLNSMGREKTITVISWMNDAGTFGPPLSTQETFTTSRERWTTRWGIYKYY